MKRTGLVGVAALVACSGAPTGEVSSFRGPTASAVFSGWTHERPRQTYPLPQPYLAVANGRSDELRLVDLATNKSVMSPGFAYPLSVPTLARPSYVAASSLRDASPDLLAVAGVGAVVDIVSTWEDGSEPGGAGGSRVVVQYDLSGVAGDGAEILSMIATPVPGVPAGTPPVAPAQPGRAWLILGFSAAADGLGGKLVVLEFTRGAGGSVVLGAPPQVKPLEFDPVSLAVSPDLFHLYCATPDVITDFASFPPAPGARQVLGVGEVDMSGGAAAPWPVRGLDARAPTTLGAATLLGERQASSPDTFDAPSPRVYAALDTSGCGAERPLECGIAVLDPALGGLAPDVAPPGNAVPAQPYRTPMWVPAMPMALAVAMPPAAGPLQCLEEAGCPPQQVKQPLMKIPAGGDRWTTAVAAVGVADGKTYLLDLGRFAAANEVSLLNSDATRVRVVSAQSYSPVLSGGSPAKAGLGLYRQYPLDGEAPGLTSEASKMPEAVIVTPGFTRSETWLLVWQGSLPGLAARSFVLGLDPGGFLSLAFQTAMGNGWAVGPRVGDVGLGIHPADLWPEGDLVQFELPVDQFVAGGNPCALAEGVKYEAIIASILPPAPDHPGGALQLAMPSDPANDPFQLLCLRDWLDPLSPPGPNGASLLAGSNASVRASGLVLVGSASGYAGRPALLTKSDVDTGQVAAKRFNLAWQDEQLVSGEALALARKARRFYYATDGFQPGSASKYPESPNGDPFAAGPALGLVVGPLCFDEPPGSGETRVCPPQRLSELQRDSFITFVTQSGVSPSSRKPLSISLPSSAVAFDRSLLPGGEAQGTVFYVTYQLDSVLMAVPGQPFTVSATIR